MFDFPTAPAVDDEYTSGGATYKWNGYGWTVSIPPVVDEWLPAGQCQLTGGGTSTIVLQPYGGDQLTIDGARRTVVAGAATLPTGVFLYDTLYYIYAFWTGTAIQLENSTTGHSTGPGGVEIKTGDPTRSLVGMAYLVDLQISFGRCLVRSWFNDPGAAAYIGMPTSVVVSIPEYELPGTQIPVLIWAGELYTLKSAAAVYGGAIGVMMKLVNTINKAGIGETYSQQCTDVNYTCAIHATVLQHMTSDSFYVVAIVGGCNTAAGCTYNAALLQIHLYGRG